MHWHGRVPTHQIPPSHNCFCWNFPNRNFMLKKWAVKQCGSAGSKAIILLHWAHLAHWSPAFDLMSTHVSVVVMSKYHLGEPERAENQLTWLPRRSSILSWVSLFKQQLSLQQNNHLAKRLYFTAAHPSDVITCLKHALHRQLELCCSQKIWAQMHYIGQTVFWNKQKMVGGGA